MSSVRRPVGPLPPHVYWRRRALVLAVLAAIVAVVVLIVVRPGAGNAEPAGSESEQPPAAPESAEPAAQGQRQGEPCLPTSVEIEPLTDATEYREGSSPQISMRITNTSAVPCTINAGTTRQLFQITSGSDVVWKSTDCQVDPVDAEVTLEPNAPQSTAPITWDRTRSDPSTCDGDRPAMPAGGASYHLEVIVGDYAGSDTKQFLLY